MMLREAPPLAFKLFYAPILVLCGVMIGACQGTQKPTYLDPEVGLDSRIDDLIERMTLSEKIAQLYNEAPAIERLGIAQYDWWNEALHGVARAGKATVYPQAIGMAATFNPHMLHDIATAVSDEARAKHHFLAEHGVRFRYTGLTFWSPNVNIFRDPRWGRGQETYGEDPYLTSTLAVQYIRGLQGDQPDYLKTSAMAKHFAVHSGPEKSRHSDNYIASPKDLTETYLPAFEAAVKEAQVESVMCAYNRVNGDPACGSDFLLQDTLRKKWGFKGHVVSDCGALADFYDPLAHNLVQSPAEAAAWALRSGTDLNCGTSRLNTFTNLHFALQREMVTEKDIDRALKRLLTTRFKLGFFDPPEQVSYSQVPITTVGSAGHLHLALQAAQESFVLLKNDGTLPLKEDITVAVIGPNATNIEALVGNYHGEPINPVTPLEGIVHHLGKSRVNYAPGSALVAEQFGHFSAIPSEHFFHRSEDGKMLSGLTANYYHVDRQSGRVGDPVLSRIDPNIDFYWTRSPLDNSVWDEFGVTWEGFIRVAEDSEYHVHTPSRGLKILLDGKPANQTITLKGNHFHRFSANITYSRVYWGSNPIEPQAKVLWVRTDDDLTAEAISSARKSDVVIFISGISPRIEGEEMTVTLPGFDHGDRTRIELPEEQTSLLKKLKTLGKPIVLVNLSGSAMAMNWETNNLNAIVQGFYPGEATGKALAQILWGKTNPSGKLPITFYKDTKELPDFKNYTMNNRTYKFFKGEPLYAFGYGQSYSEFQFRHPVVTEQDNGDLTIDYSLENLSQRAGQEVSQLYLEFPNLAEHDAVRELVAFRKDALHGAQRRHLSLTVKRQQLSYVNEQGERIAHSGPYRLSLGGGQPGASGSSNVIEWTWPSP